MDIEKLEVGDRFFGMDTLVTTEVTKIWCEYNSKKERGESLVECGAVQSDGTITGNDLIPAWEFIQIIRDGNYQTPTERILGRMVDPQENLRARKEFVEKLRSGEV